MMQWLYAIKHSWRKSNHDIPREARDTLWLLLMMALVIAPHAPQLPWWSTLGASISLLWRAYLAWSLKPLPSKKWLILLLAALLGMIWITYGTLLGRQAGITLVVVLATLKCLELKARRDALVCTYLGFFLIFMQFFSSQGLGTALLMLVSVWGLLCALILGQRPLGYPKIGEVGRHALLATLWGIPLMVTLFLLFPRIGPLWSLPSDAGPSTGLSNSLSLGDVAHLSQDSRIALRLKFLGPKPPTHHLYFRGPVLDNFDGHQWTAQVPGSDELINFSGEKLPYLITVEPHALTVVPLLEGTGQASIVHPTSTSPLVRHGLQWWRSAKNDQRVQIKATAYQKVKHGPEVGDESLLRWLRLPLHANPRTRLWAINWAQKQMSSRAPNAPAMNAQDWSQALLHHVRTQNYRYTLSPGKQINSPHTIDTFWIDQRAGFCEHFASSFVMIMRVIGIPARIVTGYQGAEINAIDGLYVVRNSNAHAWAEIWVRNKGWIRVDPTAAVAPERVETSPPAPLFATLPGPLGNINLRNLHRFRMAWEAIDNRWNLWILQYSTEQQMNLLKSWGWPNPDWNLLGKVLACALAGLAFLSALIMKMKHSQLGFNKNNAWHQILKRIDRELRRIDPTLEPLLPHNGPWPASVWHAHLQQLWDNQQPLLSEQQALLESLLALDAARYGPDNLQSDGGRSKKIKTLIDRIEQLAVMNINVKKTVP